MPFPISMHDTSLQKVTASLMQYLVIISLKSQPPLLWRPYLFITLLSLLILYNLLLIATTLSRGIDKQLRMTRLVQTQEPKCCFIYSLSYGQDAMVLQDGCFPISQRLGDVLPFFACEYYTTELLIY